MMRVPSFCRHNRLIQNCPICSREQAVELRPIVSSSAPRTSQPRERGQSQSRARVTGQSSPGVRGGLKVRRLARGADDGYSTPLLPGLRSSEDAERLAEELAFAAARLQLLEVDPPGLYAEVANHREDIEERSWLAFLIAYICPVDDEDDPFEFIRLVRTPWGMHELPDLDGVRLGPRTAHDPDRGVRTIEAYRAWAGRSGSQADAFIGDQGWTPERRFARTFERLALPGLHRGARFDLLVTLGRLGAYELRAGALQVGGDNEVTVAAKRALGIGDPMLLERRAADLAQACSLPLEALDLGFYNWERGERALPRGAARHRARSRRACVDSGRAGPVAAHAFTSAPPPTFCGVRIHRAGAAMTLCFIEPQNAIRVIAESVGREARRQILGEVVRAWVDEIPESELESHYAKAVADLDEDDLSLLAAWHASLEVGHPVPNKEFLVNVFPSLGENRREALKIAASFRGEEAFRAGVGEEQAFDTVLPWLSQERCRELARECLELYCWDRLGVEN